MRLEPVGGSYERANQGAEQLRRDDLIRPCPLRTREEHGKASEGSDGTRGQKQGYTARLMAPANAEIDLAIAGTCRS